MFDRNHYVPILKTKGGELLALRDLEARTKSLITPLLEMQPPGWDFEKKKPSKSVASQLDTSIAKIEKAWAGESPLFIDTLPLAEDPVDGGASPLCYVLRELEAVGVQCVPVLHLAAGAANISCVKKHLKDNGRGCCLRLTMSDLGTDALESTIESLRKAIGVPYEDVDLILDQEAFSSKETPRVLYAAKAWLRSIPQVDSWRSLTLAGTSFPIDMTEFRAASMNLAQRAELYVWEAIIQAPAIPRFPAFGDYGIQHPRLLELDPRLITMSANIRYAADRDWLLLRGRGVRKHGWQQYEDLCKKLVKRQEFKGSTHCAGCDYIGNCASGTVSHGNAMTWRRVGTTHHITLVADQISSHRVP